MNVLNKVSLALILILESLASKFPIPNIDEIGIVIASMKLIVVCPLGYLWNIHIMIEVPNDNKMSQSQSLQ